MSKHVLRLTLLLILISLIGVLTIYSSTINSPSQSERYIYLRQFAWLCLGFICFLGISKIYYHRLWDLAYLFYALGILFLLMVAFLGLTRLGAQRWIRVLWFNFQPSELMKLIVIIFLARYYSKPGPGLRQNVGDWGFLRAVLIPFAYISLPVILIMNQPDLGTATFIFFIFLAMLFVARVNFKFVASILLGIALASPLFWYFLKDYQKNRLMVFLNPNVDPLGSGYTIIQSKIAIASGGLFGKGWLAGSQSQLHFLPESHTDFIFASFAEEWGFLGVSLLLLLYYFLIIFVLNVARRAPDHFGRLLASGIALSLVIQIFINIAMTIGLAPVVGLPLPLLSYGGSHLVVIFLSMGILISIEKRLAS
ncbi:MAG: rod shape-determining protein RodA [Candidatus Omnitrophica bacterium]|nr:rod shape-determining protein RodA [Candidatus Omnitrophota bacterium]MBU1871702.1 rod shape-determining protein RodA [Candidatus Omnitrophota bacterium]